LYYSILLRILIVTQSLSKYKGFARKSYFDQKANQNGRLSASRRNVCEANLPVSEAHESQRLRSKLARKRSARVATFAKQTCPFACEWFFRRVILSLSKSERAAESEDQTTGDVVWDLGEKVGRFACKIRMALPFARTRFTRLGFDYGLRPSLKMTQVCNVRKLLAQISTPLRSAQNDAGVGYTIKIHPHSGWYFSFGHSPNTTGCAQVRLLLACQPCNDYLLPVNGFALNCIIPCRDRRPRRSFL